MYGVRVGDWKYIERPAEGVYELYNLRTDPEEAKNVISGFPEERKQLGETLEDWFGRYRSAGVAERVTEEATEALRALGYVPQDEDQTKDRCTDEISHRTPLSMVEHRNTALHRKCRPGSRGSG